MGRLPKEKIDRVQQMLDDGYTAPEISKEVGCSESTVYRYKKKEMGNGEEKTTEKFLLDLAKNYLQTIDQVAYNLWSANEEASGQFFQIHSSQSALELVAKCFRTLGEKPGRELVDAYWELVKGKFLDIEIKYLSSDEMKLKKEWVTFLRQHYPGKLAELVI